MLHFIPTFRAVYFKAYQEHITRNEEFRQFFLICKDIVGRLSKVMFAAPCSLLTNWACISVLLLETAVFSTCWPLRRRLLRKSLRKLSLTSTRGSPTKSNSKSSGIYPIIAGKSSRWVFFCKRPLQKPFLLFGGVIAHFPRRALLFNFRNENEIFNFQTFIRFLFKRMS